jgi:hypothetical protein
VQTAIAFPNTHSTVQKKIEREQERRKENATGTPFNFNPTTQNEKKKIPLRVCRVKQQLFF